MKRMKLIAVSICLFAVTGCAATLPQGPSVLVLPPHGKPFAQFQAEDANCRKWGERSVGISPAEAHDKSAATGAAVGALTGAGAGALLGSASGHMGAGAAIGTGIGLLMGTAVGSDAGQVSAREAQRRYDIAYVQCMASSGNQVGGSVPGYYQRRRVIVVPAEPPPVYYMTPAAPNYPPPPPVYAPADR